MSVVNNMNEYYESPRHDNKEDKSKYISKDDSTTINVKIK